FQAEDGIRDKLVTGVQTCGLPIFTPHVQLDPRNGGSIIAEYRYVLTTDQSGSFTIPPFEVRLRGATARSRPLRVVVRGSRASDRDRKSVVEGARVEAGGGGEGEGE